MKKLLVFLCGLLCLGTFAAEVIPPTPAKYFNDHAGVVSASTADQLNRQLEQFERDSSCQVLVAIFPKMQSDSSIEDYTVRVAQAWKVGQQDKKNGAVLFVFTQDHKMYLQVGYGLEGALPDALCKRIIEDEIKPSFRAGNYDAGLTAGVTAILAATKGEYQGTGSTVADQNRHASKQAGSLPFWVIVILVIVVGIIVMSKLRGGGYYSSSGWYGGGSSDGGFFSGGGGGGGFSSGGGSGGGGGAGGSW
jgi:uncharacterized protein